MQQQQKSQCTDNRDLSSFQEKMHLKVHLRVFHPFHWCLSLPTYRRGRRKDGKKRGRLPSYWDSASDKKKERKEKSASAAAAPQKGRRNSSKTLHAHAAPSPQKQTQTRGGKEGQRPPNPHGCSCTRENPSAPPHPPQWPRQPAEREPAPGRDERLF